MDDQEVQYKSLEDCLEAIGMYKDAEVIKNPIYFDTHLNIISCHHSKNGLKESHLKSLLPFVFKKNLKLKTMGLLMDCLIPEFILPEDLVTNIVLHVLGSHYDLPPYITITLLKWIIGILEYELTDVSAINDFYRVFYSLLENDQNAKIQNNSLVIIHMLTVPSDVTDENIKAIINLQTKYSITFESQAVLRLFKFYQPSKVSVKVPVMDTFDVTKYISDSMKRNLMNCRNRNLAKKSPSKNNRIPNVKLFKNDFVRSECLENIFQYSKDLDNGNKIMKISQIERFEELEQNWDNIELPHNILCLLTNDPGLHYLAFGGEYLQLKFSYKLNDVLNQVFVRCSIDVKHGEKTFLLQRIYDFQEFIKQGLFVVSKFLGCYLEYWNGMEFRNEIFQLLEWVNFSSLEELNKYILKPLYKHFILSDENTMCEILYTLSRFLKNNFQVDVYRYEQRYTPIFLKALPGWISEEYGIQIGRIINCIGNFVRVALLVEINSLNLLHECIGLYELIFELEKRSSLAVITIIPFQIVYCSLFAINITPFTRVCHLLLGYPQVINELLLNSSMQNMEREEILVKSYCSDIMNCLWWNKAISNRESGFIFKEMNENILKELYKISNADNAFSILHHRMFAPFIISIIENDLSFNTQMSQKDILKIIELHLPIVAEFIKANLKS